MSPTNRIQVPVYLAPELVAELDQLAEQRETTRQILLREAVEDYLGYRWVRTRARGKSVHGARVKVADAKYPTLGNRVARAPK